MDEGRGAVALGERGVQLLKPTLALEECEEGLRVRPLMDTLEYTTLELMLLLQEDGWEVRMKPKLPRKSKKAAADEGAEDQPEDYQHGAAGARKIWWFKPPGRAGEVEVSRWYLLALYTASKHGQPVQHFDQVASYQALVTGKPRR
eukprot:8168096-Lingulodinium_polyedra.AAC.1